MNGARGHYGLPPATALVVFEAAARHASFKVAAAELGVTPGAVSHQIKALELGLGVALFERRPRGVALTGAGETLFRALESGFTRVADALARIRHERGGRAVTVTASTAVSSLWLTPRLTRFWKAHPDVAVTQHVSDSVDDPLVPVDLRIAYEPDTLPAHGAVTLHRDTLLPLCSPAFAAAHPVGTLDALAALPLMHLDAHAGHWTSWRDWFAALGFDGPIGGGRHVNNYAIALQCARDDVGVVLGWRRLVEPLRERGHLVPLGPYELPAPASLRVRHAGEETEPTAEARLLHGWLVESVSGNSGRERGGRGSQSGGGAGGRNRRVADG